MNIKISFQSYQHKVQNRLLIMNMSIMSKKMSKCEVQHSKVGFLKGYGNKISTCFIL